jgi:hypothetical protein
MVWHVNNRPTLRDHSRLIITTFSISNLGSTRASLRERSWFDSWPWGTKVRWESGYREVLDSKGNVRLSFSFTAITFRTRPTQLTAILFHFFLLFRSSLTFSNMVWITNPDVGEKTIERKEMKENGPFYIHRSYFHSSFIYGHLLSLATKDRK